MLKTSLQDIQQRQAEELARMQEQVEQDRLAYEEKIRTLEREQSDLNNMDPDSASARNLRSKIAEDERAAEYIAQNLEAEERTFNQKMKSESPLSTALEWYRR